MPTDTNDIAHLVELLHEVIRFLNTSPASAIGTYNELFESDAADRALFREQSFRQQRIEFAVQNLGISRESFDIMMLVLSKKSRGR